MLIFTKSLRVCLALRPVDLRRGFEGLVAVVTQELNEDERSSQIFVFTNKRKDRVRLLYWDGTGLWLMTKRLEKGTFAWPKTPVAPVAPASSSSTAASSVADQSPAGNYVAPAKLPFRAEALEMLLSGIDLKGATMRPWYEDPTAKPLSLA
jgi:transposase